MNINDYPLNAHDKQVIYHSVSQVKKTNYKKISQVRTLQFTANSTEVKQIHNGYRRGFAQFVNYVHNYGTCKCFESECREIDAATTTTITATMTTDTETQTDRQSERENET